MSELVRDWRNEKKDLEEAFDIVSDKLVKADAEIREQKVLITELCDALAGMKPVSSSSPVVSEMEKEKLIQRAREAVKP